MSIQVFGCPSCQSPFQVSAEQAGQVVKCPACAQTVEIPADAFSQQPSPPPTDALVFDCPDCSGQFGFTAEMIGQHVGCPHCQATVLLRAPGSEAEKTDPETEDAPAIKIDASVSRKRKKRKTISKPIVPPESAAATDLFAPGFKNKKSPKPGEPKVEQIQPTRREVKGESSADKSQSLPTPKPPAAAQPPAPQPRATPSKSPQMESPQQPSARPSSSPPSEPAPKPSRPSKSSKSSVSSEPSKSDRPIESSKRLIPDSTPGVEIVAAEVAEVVSTAGERAGDDSKPIAASEQLRDLGEAARDAIAHLLPPRFDVDDPTRHRVSTSKGQFKVLLPDGSGGTTQIDQRVMHVKHGGQQVSLVSLSDEQKARRRLIQNIIAIVIGIIVMWLAFTLLG